MLFRAMFLVSTLTTMLAVSAFADPAIERVSLELSNSVGVTVKTTDYISKADRYKAPLETAIAMIAQPSFQESLKRFKEKCDLAHLKKINLQTSNYISSSGLSVDVNSPKWLNNLGEYSRHCEKMTDRLNAAKTRMGDIDLLASFSDVFTDGKIEALTQSEEWIDAVSNPASLETLHAFEAACAKEGSVKQIRIVSFESFRLNAGFLELQVDYRLKPEAYFKKLGEFTEKCKNFNEEFGEFAKIGVKHGLLFNYDVTQVLNKFYSFERLEEWMAFLVSGKSGSSYLPELKKKVLAASDKTQEAYKPIHACEAKAAIAESKGLKKPRCRLIPVSFGRITGFEDGILRSFFGYAEGVVPEYRIDVSVTPSL